MENPKMQLPSQFNKRTGRYGLGNNPVSCTADRAENGNLGNFEAVENNGTAYAPKQCLYQKVCFDGNTAPWRKVAPDFPNILFSALHCLT